MWPFVSGSLLSLTLSVHPHAAGVRTALPHRTPPHCGRHPFHTSVREARAVSTSGKLMCGVPPRTPVHLLWPGHTFRIPLEPHGSRSISAEPPTYGFRSPSGIAGGPPFLHIPANTAVLHPFPNNQPSGGNCYLALPTCNSRHRGWACFRALAARCVSSSENELRTDSALFRMGCLFITGS